MRCPLKILALLLISFFIFDTSASDAITIQDLHGVWIDDNSFETIESNQEFGLSFKSNGDAVVIGHETIVCPVERIKDIDGIFHIRCFENKKFEVIRFVVGGWKSKTKRILFGFQYRLADTDRILNNSGYDDPEKYRIVDGFPTTLVWFENGK